jgi:Phage terminase, small subunit
MIRVTELRIRGGSSAPNADTRSIKATLACRTRARSSCAWATARARSSKMGSLVVPTRAPIRSGPILPPHLEPEEAALFKSIVAEFRVDDVGSLQLLTTAMEAHQRCRLAREAVAKDGMMLPDRFGTLQPHPLLKAEASARGQYLAALKQLNLEPPAPSKRWIAR